MKLTIDPKKIWTFSLVLYIICSSAFSYGSLRMLNTYALYLFLGVSAVNILLTRKVKFNGAVICILLYAFLMFVGVLYTPTSESVARRILYVYVTMAVIVFCVVQYIQSIEDVKTIMFAYMLAGLALAIYVYSQYGSEFWTLMRGATDHSSGYVDRIGDDLTNANRISLFTMISTLIAAYNIIFDRTTKLKTVFCILVGVFCFVISMAAASRKSIIIMLAAFVCIWLYNSWGNKNIAKQIRNFCILIGCLILVYAMITTMPIFSGIAARTEVLLDSLETGTGTISEINRSSLIKRGFSIWMNNFLFGAGTAASDHYFGTYAHNNVVEILMNSGIIGFMLFYGVYPMTIYKYIKKAKLYRENNKLSILLFAVFVGICVASVGLVYYYERYYMVLMTVIISATKLLEPTNLGRTDSLAERECYEYCSTGHYALGKKGLL